MLETLPDDTDERIFRALGIGREPIIHSDNARGQSSSSQSVNISDVKEALKYISADSYRTWITIGFALYSCDLGPQGFALFDEWSKQSEKYKGEAETQYKWKSFAKEKTTARRITADTIFYLARKAEWPGPDQISVFLH